MHGVALLHKLCTVQGTHTKIQYSFHVVHTVLLQPGLNCVHSVPLVLLTCRGGGAGVVVSGQGQTTPPQVLSPTGSASASGVRQLAPEFEGLAGGGMILQPLASIPETEDMTEADILFGGSKDSE